MPTPGSTGDPRTGRDRRVPTRARTFKDGAIDPIIQHRRPLLTWGNVILLAIMIGYGMYATGHLPQLDEFFDHLNEVGRAHNNFVVGTLLTYGSYLFGAVILAVFGLFVFLFVNTRRRRLSDPKGWHKAVDAPERRQHDRRNQKDLPSMVMPLGKERPNRRAADRPAEAAAKTDAATPAVTVPAAADAPVTIAAATEGPSPAPSPNSAKAEAIAAAAKAEAALAVESADLPSFVMPAGKAKRAAELAPSPVELAKIIAAPVVMQVPGEKAEASALAAAAAAAKIEAAMAAAKAAAAKAEAAMAAAKADAAIAEAAMAAAKAEAAAITTN